MKFLKIFFILLISFNFLNASFFNFLSSPKKEKQLQTKVQEVNFQSLTPSDLFYFMKKYGSDYHKVISETDFLKVVAEKIYIQHEKKILLLKVINKTGTRIDIKESIGYGYPLSRYVEPNSYSYILVFNFPLNKIYKYDVSSFNKMLFDIITSSKFINIRSYFVKNPIIVKLGLPEDVKILTKDQFDVDFLGKGPFIAFTRIDREIDSKTNRWGLFVNGFLKINSTLYSPYTIYFVMQQGKIVKIIYINKFLNFQSFKALIYRTSH